MTKPEKIMSILIGIGALTVPIVFFLAARLPNVVITQDQIQHKLDEKVPATASAEFVEAWLDSADVYFDDGQVGLDVDYLLNVEEIKFFNKVMIPQQEIRGTFICDTDIRYLGGKFYLENVRVRQFKGADVSPKLVGQVNDLLNEVFTQIPIYSLHHKDYKHDLARLVLDDVVIENNTIIAKLSI
jgi:hypothetical protein